MTVALETLFVSQYVELEDEEGNMLVGQIQKIDSTSFEIGSILSKHRVSVTGLITKEVFVYFQGETGAKFQFRTKVISQVTLMPIKLQLAIPKDDEILKVQQREYFRVKTRVNFQLDVAKEKLHFLTKDLSGGGLSFFSKDALFTEKVESLDGVLTIENVEIPFSGRVVYQNQKERGYHIALEYTNIRESHRNVIIKFCMKEQLKSRN